MRAAIAIACVAAWTAVARAQPAPTPPDEEHEDRTADTGFIGRKVTDLEIDDCKHLDPSLGQDALRKLASEHYQRGETLYVQGEYDGAVKELVTAYCLVPFYVVLKDIGQAYERSLEYEKAIGYLERYLSTMPPDAKKLNACAPDPADDKEVIRRRIRVLQNLPSRVYVGTTPGGARITISDVTGIKARAKAGEQILIAGGTYDMLVELDNYVPYHEKIDVRIGKPYTFFVPLQPEKGTLSIQVTPPDARLYLDNRFVGVGRFDEKVPGGTYEIAAEAPDRERTTLKVQVIANQTRRELMEMEEIPQTGRRQLIIASGIGGFVGVGSLLLSTDDFGISGIAGLVGGGAGLVISYFALPRDLSLGTSNLAITTGVAGALAGRAAAQIFTRDDRIASPVSGASLFLGAGLGYLAGERTKIRVGDAALFNSTLVWGGMTGLLLATALDPGRDITSGITLSGLGMGFIGGLLLTRNFDISRTHAVLIDLGGVAGVIGGLAMKSLVYPSDFNSQERLANFALGGMALGLITAGVLTRNMDEPEVPVRASVGATTDASGKSTTTYGIEGTW
ncbi:MAG: PEGA domain-containing protein [Kofleriaceae bacterium]